MNRYNWRNGYDVIEKDERRSAERHPKAEPDVPRTSMDHPEGPTREDLRP